VPSLPSDSHSNQCPRYCHTPAVNVLVSRHVAVRGRSPRAGRSYPRTGLCPTPIARPSEAHGPLPQPPAIQRPARFGPGLPVVKTHPTLCLSPFARGPRKIHQWPSSSPICRPWPCRSLRAEPSLLRLHSIIHIVRRIMIHQLAACPSSPTMTGARDLWGPGLLHRERTMLSPCLGTFAHSCCARVKHRRRTSTTQLKVLESHYAVNPKPDVVLRKALANQLTMTPREVQVWVRPYLHVYRKHSV
jgi:hypothetical protein